MSDWVEYCNLESAGRWTRARRAAGYEAPHNVKYWSVGNENYGSWEMGAKTRDEWGPFVAESAKMMRRVDPDIKLFAAAAHDVSWNLALLSGAGQYLDYISLHTYADPLGQVDSPSDYETCMTRVLMPEQIIKMAKHVIAAAGYEGRVGIAFDEWNLRSWHHPVFERFRMDISGRDRNDINTTYTMADAVFSACFLNSCLRHCDTVKIANMAPVINTRGPLYVYPEGIVKRTTFHVMAMYASHLQPNVADIWADCGSLERPALTLQSDLRKTEGAAGWRRYGPPEVDVPVLDVIATCDSAKSRWSIVVVNRHAEKEIAATIGLGDSMLSGVIDAVVLAAPDVNAYNDIEHPDRVVPELRKQTFDTGHGVFPPHSVTILKIGEA
jgi:alpha-N-arabinofuranosidase